MIRKKMLIEFYDAVSRTYDDLYGLEQRLKYEAILEGINLCGLILDAGCGTGLFYEYVEKLCEYVGFDISYYMVKRCTVKYGKYWNANFICCDLEMPPFRPNVFDCIVAVTVVHHVNMVKAINLIQRMLKGGGVAVVTIPYRFSREIEEFEKTISSSNKGIFIIRVEEGKEIRDIIYLLRCDKWRR
ncbi:MAG: hypothetical protein DRO65_02470 [Candidatus Altiarchaeales archaeon]|nr:MAG: hypothetical protein DRO65_02470 [Candidatus Altiarchaeales archaeon]